MIEFTSGQKTFSEYTKKFPNIKIYNDKIYYIWQETDVNDSDQIWSATSNLDGTNFIETQLTNEVKSMNNPELYIYDSKIYMTWYGIAEDGGKYQIWIASMNLDGTEFKVLYNTNTTWGAKYPKIAVNTNAIYLAYQERYLSHDYYHMIYAKLNFDGSNFISYSASNSANETVKNVDLFVTEDNIYYIWNRHYFIDEPASLKIYSADENLLNFTQVLSLKDSSARNIYIKNGKIYFTWVPYANRKGMCSIINIDGSEYKDILISNDSFYSLLQVTTDMNGNDIIDLSIVNQTDVSFPTKIYQLSSASLNINTSEYIETELINNIITGFNNKPSVQFIKNNNIIYYVWNQYDENNKYQIWLGILGDKNTIIETKDSTALYILGGAIAYLLLSKKKITLTEYMKLNR